MTFLDIFDADTWTFLVIFGAIWIFWCHLDICGGILIFLVAFGYLWLHLDICGCILISLVAFWYFWWHLDICGCGVMREGGEPAAGSANIGVFVRLCLAFVHLQRKLQEHLWNCASGKYSQLWTKWYRKICSPNYFDLRDCTGKQNTSSQPWGGHMLQHFVKIIEEWFVDVKVSKVFFFGINPNSFMRKPVSLSSTLQHITFCLNLGP